MKDVLARQRQVHFVCWVNRLDADRALVFPFESLRILSFLGITWAPVGLGDAEGLVLLPICSLAVLAAVKDQATAGAVEEYLLAALAVVAGFVPDARGRLLLLGRHVNEGIKTG